ncbi:MAG TPA: ABC transporter ATP-binding protein [Gemmatimonadales bacterium]|jgi:Cu-processing system ATP-binding protein
MIVTAGVAKRFGRRTVLHDLDTRVVGGRVTALVGPNGAGKTTFLKLLLGLARPDAGAITIAGRVLDGSPGYRAAIGYMPQMARFPAHLSGRELLATLVSLRPDRVAPDLALATAFDLGDAFGRPLGTLSGGTRQRINAVLAFAFRPDLIILDEPTAGLDPLASRVLKDRILAERVAGRTVLITSHALPELEELADDVLFLADGTARWQGAASALKVSTGQGTLERAVAQLLAGRPILAAA